MALVVPSSAVDSTAGVVIVAPELGSAAGEVCGAADACSCLWCLCATFVSLSEGCNQSPEVVNMRLN